MGGGEGGGGEGEGGGEGGGGEGGGDGGGGGAQPVSAVSVQSDTLISPDGQSLQSVHVPLVTSPFMLHLWPVPARARMHRWLVCGGAGGAIVCGGAARATSGVHRRTVFPLVVSAAAADVAILCAPLIAIPVGPKVQEQRWV